MEKTALEMQLYYSEDYTITHDIFQRVWSVVFPCLFFFFHRDPIGYIFELNLFLQIIIATAFIAFLLLPSILYYFFCKANKVLVKVQMYEKYLNIHFYQKSWIYPQNKISKIYWGDCETYKFNVSAKKGDLMLTTIIIPSKFYLATLSAQDLDMFSAFQNKIQAQWKDYNLQADKQNKVWQYDESKTFLGKLQSIWALIILVFAVCLSYYLYSKRETPDHWELAKYILLTAGFSALAILQIYHSFFKPKKP